MNTTTLFPTMTIIYRWNRKLVISTLISYLIHVYRVFNHLSRLFGFSLSSPLRLSVFGQLITHLNLLCRRSSNCDDRAATRIYFYVGRHLANFVTIVSVRLFLAKKVPATFSTMITSRRKQPSWPCLISHLVLSQMTAQIGNIILIPY